jgi:hydroxymethylpyrimidine/phosphomethylpyrimidine kinase
VDLLVDADGVREFRAPRVRGTSTHGTGCTFSAAIAAGLARGLSVAAAVDEARTYLSAAMAQAPDLGHGHGPLNHFPSARIHRTDEADWDAERDEPKAATSTRGSASVDA